MNASWLRVLRISRVIALLRNLLDDYDDSLLARLHCNSDRIHSTRSDFVIDCPSHAFPIDCHGGACIASVSKHPPLRVQCSVCPYNGQSTIIALSCLYNWSPQTHARSHLNGPFGKCASIVADATVVLLARSFTRFLTICVWR